MELHRIVQEARRRKGLTQEELAEQTGITVRTIQRIESGETTPRAFTLKTIAGALDLPLSALQPEEAVPVVPAATVPDALPAAAEDTDDNAHFLRFFCLSCFSCLLVPMVHFLVPFLLYRSRSRRLAPAERRFARGVILGQVYWVLALSGALLLALCWNLWQGRTGWQLPYVLVALLLYGVNAVLIFRSAARASKLATSA